MTARVNQAPLKHKYLPLDQLRRLLNMQFSPRRRIEGRYAGHYSTRLRGQSVEFHEYRDYQPGDDPKTIDWKVFGRSDRYYVRLFEHHSELTAHLLIDASASMAYRGTGERTDSRKFDHACALAGAIAFLLIQQQDRCSLSFARRGLVRALPAGAGMGHLLGMLGSMERMKIGKSADLAAAVSHLKTSVGKRDLLIVISDPWEPRTELRKALGQWVERGGEALMIFVHHPDELQLPAAGRLTLIDSERQTRVQINSDELRNSYIISAKELLGDWTKQLSGAGIDCVQASMTEPLTQSLEQFLARRGNRR